MRFHHNLFQPLHFDYGTMVWSVIHMPLFGSILSICDHRRLGAIHNVTFYALMRVLTNGKIKERQAQATFDHIDLGLKGDMFYSEIAFLTGILVAQNDNMEREFLYMNAWKMWVTFNEFGQDRITTREFRRTGLFFDFDYPTMYEMFKDYNWDDEKDMEFERFRFYLMSCIHFRHTKRFQAKCIRYRQFKRTVLLLLRGVLTRVLLENVYPSPFTILRAIKTIKIPPLEGTERTKRWTDIFDFSFVRKAVNRQWQAVKLFWITRMEYSQRFKCCCTCLCCGFWCFAPADAESCCGSCSKLKKNEDGSGRGSCLASCGFCCRRCKKKKDEGKETPWEPPPLVNTAAEEPKDREKLAEGVKEKLGEDLPSPDTNITSKSKKSLQKNKRGFRKSLKKVTINPKPEVKKSSKEVPLDRPPLVFVEEEVKGSEVEVVPSANVTDRKESKKESKSSKKDPVPPPDVEIDLEHEWEPLGRPKFECGIQ